MAWDERAKSGSFAGNDRRRAGLVNRGAREGFAVCADSYGDDRGLAVVRADHQVAIGKQRDLGEPRPELLTELGRDRVLRRLAVEPAVPVPGRVVVHRDDHGLSVQDQEVHVSVVFHIVGLELRVERQVLSGVVDRDQDATVADDLSAAGRVDVVVAHGTEVDRGSDSGEHDVAPLEDLAFLVADRVRSVGDHQAELRVGVPEVAVRLAVAVRVVADGRAVAGVAHEGLDVVDRHRHVLADLARRVVVVTDRGVVVVGRVVDASGDQEQGAEDQRRQGKSAHDLRLSAPQGGGIVPRRVALRM